MTDENTLSLESPGTESANESLDRLMDICAGDTAGNYQVCVLDRVKRTSIQGLGPFPASDFDPLLLPPGDYMLRLRSSASRKYVKGSAVYRVEAARPGDPAHSNNSHHVGLSVPSDERSSEGIGGKGLEERIAAAVAAAVKNALPVASGESLGDRLILAILPKLLDRPEPRPDPLTAQLVPALVASITGKGDKLSDTLAALESLDRLRGERSGDSSASPGLIDAGLKVFSRLIDAAPAPSPGPAAAPPMRLIQSSAPTAPPSPAAAAPTTPPADTSTPPPAAPMDFSQTIGTLILLGQRKYAAAADEEERSEVAERYAVNISDVLDASFGDGWVEHFGKSAPGEWSASIIQANPAAGIDAAWVRALEDSIRSYNLDNDEWDTTVTSIGETEEPKKS